MRTFTLIKLVLLVWLALVQTEIHGQQINLIENPRTCPDFIPLDGSQGVTINPDDGNLTATVDPEFDCPTGTGDPLVSLNPADGGFFTVNGGNSTEVSEGGSVTFDYFARGAYECSGSGLPGTSWNISEFDPIGPESVSLTGLSPDVYTVQISCSNNGSFPPASSSVDVTITQSSLEIPAECENVARPTGDAAEFCVTTRQGVDTTRSCFEYSEVFGSAFPGDLSAINFFLNRNEWAAMKFDVAGMSATRGTWAREIPQVVPTTTGPRIMTISTCPGDFDRNNVGPNCYFKSTDNEMLWKRKGEFPNTAACELDPAVPRYYFNVIYTDQPAGTPTNELEWDCGSSSTAGACSDSLTPSFQ